MKLAAIQHDIVWENPEENFKRLMPMIEAAAEKSADLIILTEMFSWGFSMNTENIAEAPDGQSPSFLKEAARKLGVWVCGTYPERVDGEVDTEVGSPPAFNMFLLAGPNGESHKYAKIHPFSYGGEDKHYQAGSETLTLNIGGVSVAAFICYDLRFGEDFWKLADGTDLYILPSNWPASRRNHWQKLLAARAIENQAYVAGVNRVGEGDGILYAGDSVIFDPRGEILAKSQSWDKDTNDLPKAGAGVEEEILIADIDPAYVKETRQKFPFLQDRL